ncbi:unnamed protein product [Rangifer tarandus platyrhynchus]|uniref:Uncharacterized protein n=2 Tax=Rangifer tarandus platyrhynchus TaxID=3082113 RepID=A0ACB0EY87_RANTA|nr:unnamed protein product [Rangifer tarandus platyrhynchus]
MDAAAIRPRSCPRRRVLRLERGCQSSSRQTLHPSAQRACPEKTQGPTEVSPGKSGAPRESHRPGRRADRSPLAHRPSGGPGVNGGGSRGFV